jgi:hypothetical protein
MPSLKWAIAVKTLADKAFVHDVSTRRNKRLRHTYGSQYTKRRLVIYAFCMLAASISAREMWGRELTAG